MGDARDILGVSRTGSSEKRRTSKESHKKPDGVSREVYSLLGELPPVISSSERNKTKPLQEPTDPHNKLGWRLVPFSSSARTDNLQLRHWERVMLEKEAPEESSMMGETDGSSGSSSVMGDTDGSTGVEKAKKLEGPRNFPYRPQYKAVAGPPKDYPFAKFNQPVEVIRYTDEEYRKYLEDKPGGWTREETDKLFDLCEQFDLRFIVIADRFPTARTVEELKDRYYSAGKVILEKRAASLGMIVDHPLITTAYDYDNEVHRKKTLATLLSRSRKQDREDDELLDVAQRIREHRYKEKLAEKERMAELKKKGKLPQGENPEEADLAAIMKKFGVTVDVEGGGSSPNSPTSPRGLSPVSPPIEELEINPSRVETEAVPAKVGSTEGSATGSSTVTAVEETPNIAESVGVYAEAAPDSYVFELKVRNPGAFLRSKRHAKMVQEFSTQVGARNARRINQMMEKYTCRKVKMFTKEVCASHLELRKELHELLRLEERSQLIEADIEALKTPPKALEKTSPSTPIARRSQRGTDGATPAAPTAGSRVSTREKRRSVRTMEQ